MLLSTSKLVKVVGPRRLFSEALECSLPVLAVKNRYLAQEFIGTNYNLYILINCVIYISERKLHMLRIMNVTVFGSGFLFNVIVNCQQIATNFVPLRPLPKNKLIN